MLGEHAAVRAGTACPDRTAARRPRSPVTRHGRPLLLVCQSVGSRSYSSTVRFSVTRFTVNAALAVRPLEYRRVSDELERVGLDHAERLIVVAQAVVRVAHVRERRAAAGAAGSWST